MGTKLIRDLWLSLKNSRQLLTPKPELNGVDNLKRAQHVTPLSIGLEVGYGKMQVIIPRNTPIPTKLYGILSRRTFRCRESVGFPIYQGERSMARKNRFLGKLSFTNNNNVPPAASRNIRDTYGELRGWFGIDADGTLTVRVKDLATGKEQEMRVEGVAGGKRKMVLSEEEVERMVREGQEHKVADQKYVEEMDAAWEAMNSAWSMMRRAQMSLINVTTDGEETYRTFKNVAMQMLNDFKPEAKDE